MTQSGSRTPYRQTEAANPRHRQDRIERCTGFEQREKAFQEPSFSEGQNPGAGPRTRPKARAYLSEAARKWQFVWTLACAGAILVAGVRSGRAIDAVRIRFDPQFDTSGFFKFDPAKGISQADVTTHMSVLQAAADQLTSQLVDDLAAITAPPDPANDGWIATPLDPSDPSSTPKRLSIANPQVGQKENPSLCGRAGVFRG